MSERPVEPALLGAVRSLRQALAGVDLPLDVPGWDVATATRADLLAQLDDYVLPRLADLDAPILAVVGGSTGAGKSTIVNSIARGVVSRSGVLRPTTRASVLVHHPDDEGWFTTPRVLPTLARISGQDTGHEDPASVRLVGSTRLPAGVALLDAPDIDSVVQANRDLSRQLLAAADLWVFVTTAARYADAVPWDLLRTAVERGTSVTIVLNRTPLDALEVISRHLSEMLSEQGLGHAPVFAVTETTLTTDGLIPEAEIEPLRDWLSRLGADARARGAVVKHTLAGALDSLERRAVSVAEASEVQSDALTHLRSVVDESYDRALREVSEAVSDGTLLRGEVLARWQEFVGTGEFLRHIERRVARWRDRFTAALKGQPMPPDELGEALQSGVAQLLVAHAEDAAIDVTRRWRSLPGGSALAGAPGGATLPPAFVDRTQRLVRDWQSDILDLVRAEGKDRRTTARMLAFGVNGLGVILLLVVFSQTMGLSGGEVGIAGGAAVLAQRLLEAVFGDQAVRELAAKARSLLMERAKDLYQTERDRMAGALEAVAVDPAQANRLREAVAAVKAQR